MMLFKDYVRSGISAGLMLLLFVSSTAQAESACKGLASSQCSGKSGCVWVGGYTRKDNRKVSGYCRAKGGKGATTGKTAKKASSSRDSSSTSEPIFAGNEEDVVFQEQESDGEEICEEVFRKEVKKGKDDD